MSALKGKEMEITLKRHLPSSERVRIFLGANPDLTYEEAETHLSSYSIDCAAKGREVSWTLCLSCPHNKLFARRSIDLKLKKVECNYEPNERRLEMFRNRKRKKMEFAFERTDLDDQDDDLDLPVVECPLGSEEVTIDRCADCLYQRRGEWENPEKNIGLVGWVLCAAPSNLDKVHELLKKTPEGKIRDIKGKKVQMIAPLWK